MLDSTKHQIMQKIISYSDGDDHLGELLSYCIGRLCLKSAKAGELWRKELDSIDVPHIVDWLKAAIINDDAWLKNVDDKNRPKKLMKFGSFEDIQKEADKAMLRANQQNSDIKLIEGDEELYMQLEDGYHLVKLLTPAALDREGSQMQHCIGGGAYDHDLNSDEHYFLSLRDGFGKPHATLEVSGNGFEQLQGKQNKPPHVKYTKALKPFFAQEKLEINLPIRYLGYVISSEGDAYELNDLPENLKVIGRLNLVGTPIKELPAGLKVRGNLHLEGTALQSLPAGLEVRGNLDLAGTFVQSLPEGLKVGGDLDLTGTPIESLPKGLIIGGDLRLVRTSVRSLPEGLKVRGNLQLAGLPIKMLPEGLEVGGCLDLRWTPINSLPKGLKVDGNLDLFGLGIDSLPEGLEIGGHLNINGTSIKSLPEELKVGGDLSFYGTSIKSLPKRIEVGGEVHGLPEQNETVCFNLHQ